MNRIKSLFTFFIIGLWAINCSSADKFQEHKIIVEKFDDGVALGVLVSNLSEEDKDELKVSEGAKILSVLEESAAEEAGLEKDDVIIKLDGTAVMDAANLDELMEGFEEEKTVNLVIIRGGEEKSFDVTLKALKDNHVSMAFSSDGDTWSWHSPGTEKDLSWFSDDGENMEIIVDKFEDGDFSGLRISEEGKGGFLGVSATKLKEQMREYFEVEHGVLIEEIVIESPAEKAGLKAGDVITYIEDRKIEDNGDLIRTINYYDPEEEIQIQYVRKGTKKSTKAILSEKKGSNVFFHGGDEDFILKTPGAAGSPRIRMNRIFKGKPGMLKKMNIKGGKGSLYVL